MDLSQVADKQLTWRDPQDQKNWLTLKRCENGSNKRASNCTNCQNQLVDQPYAFGPGPATLYIHPVKVTWALNSMLERVFWEQQGTALVRFLKFSKDKLNELSNKWSSYSFLDKESKCGVKVIRGSSSPKLPPLFQCQPTYMVLGYVQIFWPLDLEFKSKRFLLFHSILRTMIIQSFSHTLRSLFNYEKYTLPKEVVLNGLNRVGALEGLAARLEEEGKKRLREKGKETADNTKAPSSTTKLLYGPLQGPSPLGNLLLLQLQHMIRNTKGISKSRDVTTIDAYSFIYSSFSHFIARLRLMYLLDTAPTLAVS